MPHITEQIYEFLQELEEKHGSPETFTYSFNIYDPSHLPNFEYYATDKSGLGRISFNEGSLEGVKNWWSFHYQPDGRGLYLMSPKQFEPEDYTLDKYVDYGIRLYLVGDEDEYDLGRGYFIEYSFLKYYFIDVPQEAWTKMVMTLRVEITLKRVPKTRGADMYVVPPLESEEETERLPTADTDEEAEAKRNFIKVQGMIFIENYFMNYELSDVLIKCQDTIFPAHRIVLNEKCPEFIKLHCMDSEERGSGDSCSSGKTCLDVPDVAPVVMEEFLRFIYTGSVNDMTEAGFDLYELGRQLLMDDLMDYCIETMDVSMTGANSLNYYVFGKTKKIERLVERALDAFYSYSEDEVSDDYRGYYSEAESEDQNFDEFVNEVDYADLPPLAKTDLENDNFSDDCDVDIGQEEDEIDAETNVSDDQDQDYYEYDYEYEENPSSESERSS